jgi:hypothetical protein
MDCRSVGHRTLALFICVGLFGAAPLALLPSAGADVVAYLVNVTVRPGYNFANADHALNYGHGICDKVSGGQTYVDVMTEVRSDFATSDDYQAAYLVNQAVNELCPAMISQLRNSAVHYRPAYGGR